MHEIMFIIGGRAVTLLETAFGVAALVVALLMLIVISHWRGSSGRAIEAAANAERARELDDKVADLNRLQSELTGRIQAMAELFGSRQVDLTRAVAERMDSVRSSIGQGLDQQGQRQAENLQKLNERLAVIDRAQANLADLTNEVLVLKDILANKQTRGAFGQGRMEAIVRDGLPANAFTFQATLSNRSRPDCLIHLPVDHRPLAVDAKFPLEAFQALELALTDEAQAAAERQVRGDLNRHVADIAGKYLIPGETQDLAMMFIPSESLYATIADRFEDVVQKAHRQRVIIVSPSLLMMAIQVMQAIVRDARMRDQAGLIQKEVGLLLDDVRRLAERTSKLDNHFRQAIGDVTDIATSAEKIARRGGRIESLEFENPAPAAATEPAAAAPKLRAGQP